MPEDKCTKTGESEMEVLRTKHPDVRPLSEASFYAYHKNPPEMVPVDITDDVVTVVVGRLSGGAGQRGLNQSVSNIGSSGSERLSESYG